jgi:hypothetical protein
LKSDLETENIDVGSYVNLFADDIATLCTSRSYDHGRPECGFECNDTDDYMTYSFTSNSWEESQKAKNSSTSPPLSKYSGNPNVRKSLVHVHCSCPLDLSGLDDFLV